MQLPLKPLVKKYKYVLSDLINTAKWNRAISNGDTLFLGPWLGEVGPELQYWIPFLQQAKARGFFGRKKIIAVSRGGVEAWYGNVTDSYVDIFDHLTPQEYRSVRASVLKTTQKQLTRHPWEMHFIEEVSKKLGIGSYALMHPAQMWHLVVAWLQERLLLSRVHFQLKFQKLAPSPSSYAQYVDKLHLPRNFIVARFYTSHVFEGGKSNEEQVKKILIRISRFIPVVILTMNYGVDDHGSMTLPRSTGIIQVGSNLPLRKNLGIQTEVIRRAKGFIGTNGGISVLPALVGIPCLSFYNITLGEYISIYSKHETVTTILNEQLNQGRYAVVNFKTWEKFTDWFMLS